MCSCSSVLPARVFGTSNSSPYLFAVYTYAKKYSCGITGDGIIIVNH